MPGKQALRCLVEALDFQAAGIYWREGEQLVPRAQWPLNFVLSGDIERAAANPAYLDKVTTSSAGASWLVVPMRANGVTLGRLWVVAPPDPLMNGQVRELLTLIGNQLAMAQENRRLYQEVTRLAQRRGALLRRIIDVQDERCRRVSRELHDEINQSLAALVIDVDTILAADPTLSRDLQSRLKRVRAGLRRTTDEITRIVLDLRPTLLEDHGLLAALHWYGTERLRPVGTRFHMTGDGPVPRLLPHVETTVYRIGQEALTNIARHVLLADDHAVLRDSMKAFLELYPEIEVVGEAKNGVETIRESMRLQPNVILLDVAMPKLSGLEVTRRLKRELPQSKIVILSQYYEPDIVLPILRAGADGYVLKKAGGAEVVQAIHAVHRGEAYLHPVVAQMVLDLSIRGDGVWQDPLETLTDC